MIDDLTIAMDKDVLFKCLSHPLWMRGPSLTMCQKQTHFIDKLRFGALPKKKRGFINSQKELDVRDQSDSQSNKKYINLGMSRC